MFLRNHMSLARVRYHPIWLFLPGQLTSLEEEENVVIVLNIVNIVAYHMYGCTLVWPRRADLK